MLGRSRSNYTGSSNSSNPRSRCGGLVLRALSAALRLLVLLQALSLLSGARADRRGAAAASVAAFQSSSALGTRGARAAPAPAQRRGAAATMAFATAANNGGVDGVIPLIEVPADKYDGVRVYR